MDEDAVIRHITAALTDTEIETSDGSHFFFCGAERQFPFATLVTKDSYDHVSDLDRPGVFRLNFGLSKETFLALFGEKPAHSGEAVVAKPAEDFTVLDRLLPHPIYGSMFWACVLNPSAATFERSVKALLAEAHGLAASRQARRAGD